MQSASFKIWTRVVVSISYDDNHYTTGIRSWLTELKQSTPVVQIKDSARYSMWTPEFDMKHLKKAEWHIGWNVVIITNNDKINSPNILSKNNDQASSQKFRQINITFFPGYVHRHIPAGPDRK